VGSRPSGNKHARAAEPGNAAWDAADRAEQVYGGRGWSTLYRVGRHLMDVRVCRIYEGTDEILKLKVAASVLGKKYEAFK
jgi:alkylation response protein AidB-like acyl-CoA dehydrogenase